MQTPASDPIHAIERFLAQVDGAESDTGSGVGLGEEVVLRGEITGVGLCYEKCVVHLAVFPNQGPLVGVE
jgi:hypothetical protein